MRVLQKCIRNEFSKLISRKKYTVLLIISALICLGRVGAGILISRLSHDIINTTKISGILMELFPFFAEILVPLVMFMAVTDLFATEIHDLTIKATLMRPVSRFKVMSAKIFSVFLMGILFYFSLFVICSVLETLTGTMKSSVYFFQTLGAYLIDLIPLFVIILMAVVINLLSKGSTLAMFLCIITYALMKYCNYFIPILNPMLFTAYNQWHKLWIGSTLPISALLPKVGVLLGSGMILYTGGFILFDRKEF